MLKTLRHPNIVQLLDVLHNDRKLVLVFECMDTDLRKYIDSFGGSGVDRPAVQARANALITRTRSGSMSQ